ncbi:hypothetical protein [Veronia pacifica]|nr:hypothetical protein [Veronia pacifica]
MTKKASHVFNKITVLGPECKNNMILLREAKGEVHIDSIDVQNRGDIKAVIKRNKEISSQQRRDITQSILSRAGWNQNVKSSIGKYDTFNANSKTIYYVVHNSRLSCPQNSWRQTGDNYSFTGPKIDPCKTNRAGIHLRFKIELMRSEPVGGAPEMNFVRVTTNPSFGGAGLYSGKLAREKGVGSNGRLISPFIEKSNISIFSWDKNVRLWSSLPVNIDRETSYSESDSLEVGVSHSLGWNASATASAGVSVGCTISMSPGCTGTFNASLSATLGASGNTQTSFSHTDSSSVSYSKKTYDVADQSTYRRATWLIDRDSESYGCDTMKRPTHGGCSFAGHTRYAFNPYYYTNGFSRNQKPSLTAVFAMKPSAVHRSKFLIRVKLFPGQVLAKRGTTSEGRKYTKFQDSVYGKAVAKRSFYVDWKEVGNLANTTWIKEK